MPRAKISDQIELEYETFGESTNEAFLIIMGCGVQMIELPEGFCEALASKGFHVIRFDNRDIGLSSRCSGEAPSGASVGFGFLKRTMGLSVDAAYTLEDMARDSFGLLDFLKITTANVAGVSMGGMIAQTMAIMEPTRVKSLVSINSTTGNASLPSAPILAVIKSLKKRPADLPGQIEWHLALLKNAITPKYYNEEKATELAKAIAERAGDYSGFQRQTSALLAQKDRTVQLRDLRIPTLVLHGKLDQMMPVVNGEATAMAVPGSELLVIEEMAHDLPEACWAQAIDAMTVNSKRGPIPEPKFVVPENPVPSAEWVSDTTHNVCMDCSAHFSLLRRRHHCRNCGRILCDACTPVRGFVRGVGCERVCKPCHPVLTMKSANWFFEACETGKGWDFCKEFCTPEPTFDSQANPLAGMKLLEEYCNWMKGISTVTMPDSSYEIHHRGLDTRNGTVTFFATFKGTHTGEGPCPPTGQSTTSHYVYVLRMPEGKVQHLTKVWNAAWAMNQLGWKEPEPEAPATDAAAEPAAEPAQAEPEEPTGDTAVA